MLPCMERSCVIADGGSSFAPVALSARFYSATDRNIFVWLSYSKHGPKERFVRKAIRKLVVWISHSEPRAESCSARM